MGRFAVSVGEGDEGTVTLSKAARDLHMQVVGLSGQGKSYFLEHLIRQDILNGAGVCLIDPHGEVFKNLVDWIAAKGLHRTRTVHLIELARGRYSVGFNPLCRRGGDISARVGAMLDASQKVWGDEESGGHKTLAKLLRLVFTSLAAKRLSVREAPLFANIAHTQVRQRLIADIGDVGLSEGWAEVDALDVRERAQQFAAVQNRMRAMIETPVLRTMLGQTEHLLDFTRCMNLGQIVLVNLEHKGLIEPQSAQMLGALLTADMFYSAQVREVSEAKHQPFYAYIDECGQYLNETVVRALDETRKYGLHYILSHQRLAQLGQRSDDPIRNGVVGGAQNKAVFMLEDKDSTTEMGELLFGKSFDFEKPKQSLIKPVVVGYEREYLHADGSSEGYSEGAGTGHGIGLSASEGVSVPDTDNPTQIVTTGAGASESSFSTTSSGRSWSRSASRHEALIPILEDRPTAVFSLEEQRHMAAVAVRSLAPRTAFLYSAEDRAAVQFRTPDVSPAKPSLEQIDAFYSALQREPSRLVTDAAEVAIASRRSTLVGLDDVLDDDAFWTAT